MLPVLNLLRITGHVTCVGFTCRSIFTNTATPCYMAYAATAAVQAVTGTTAPTCRL